MEDSSLVNLALRSVLIWVLVIILMFSVPSAKLPISSVFLISTMVIVLYGLIEYVNLQYSSSIYRMVCGQPDDKYVQDAIAKLKLNEKSGPPVTPVPQAPVPAAAPPAPQVQVAAPAAPPAAPVVAPPAAPVVAPPAAQVAVPAAPPAAQVAAPPAAQVAAPPAAPPAAQVAAPAAPPAAPQVVREGFGNYRF